jgi:hypothetical protein
MIYLLAFLTFLNLVAVLIVLIALAYTLLKIRQLYNILIAHTGCIIAIQAIETAHTQHQIAVSNAVQSLSAGLREALSAWYIVLPKGERLN